MFGSHYVSIGQHCLKCFIGDLRISQWALSWELANWAYCFHKNSKVGQKSVNFNFYLSKRIEFYNTKREPEWIQIFKKSFRKLRNPRWDAEYDKSLAALQIYEITSLKGMLHKDIDLSNFELSGVSKSKSNRNCTQARYSGW